MAEQKPCNHTAPCLCAAPGPDPDPRHFSDKELREKAGRWALAIRNGGAKGIPADLEEAKALAGKLLTPADAAVFTAALDKALAPPSGEKGTVQ